MDPYKKYFKLMSNIAHLKSAAAVLNWDQEVMMPPKGGNARIEQLTVLKTTIHQLLVSDELRKVLSELKTTSLNPTQRLNVDRTVKDLEIQNKYSLAFVERSSRVISGAYDKWIQARTQNDYHVFEPSLAEIIKLKQEESELLGYSNSNYNAHIQLYDESFEVQHLDVIFAQLKRHLVPMVESIAKAKAPDDGFLFKNYQKAGQIAFTEKILSQIGFDMEAGRQDVSVHPFTIAFNPVDVRLTTRVNEHDLTEAIFGTIHEGGHGMYEQGLNPQVFGLPQGEFCSLGIHESQSRLWENSIGRSELFWNTNFAELKTTFAKQLQNISPRKFYLAINKVKPSLIRTSADELTYHLHIIIRYEIEKDLMEGKISTKELVEVWNQKYEQYLGIKPQNHVEGVLQDIHWSHGSIGYFPTYSVGSLLAVQFYDAAMQKNTYTNSNIAATMNHLHNWLKKNIYQHGRLINTQDICKAATGKTLNAQCFVDYIHDKYANIYDLKW